MKRLFFAISFLGIALVAGAQNIYDAANFSQNQYYGTARTLGLSNAVTAVGGDLGTIGINPAGSAVAGYSQFTITPGLTISSTSTAYSPVGTEAFEGDYRQSNTRFVVPNVGFSLNIDTGNEWGVKNFTFAFVSNRTNTYHNFFSGFGSNKFTSRFAELASGATMWQCNPAYLNEYNSYYQNNGDWDLITAYRSNLFSEFNEDNEFAGNSEVLSSDKTYHYVPGALNQAAEVRRYGYKNDLVFNFGANVNDIFYFGFNLGIPQAMYRYDELYSESAQNPDLFPIDFLDGSTCFRAGSLDYSYSTSISGIYGKLGAIVLPTSGLRIGLAFQTPALYTVKEAWDYAASSSYVDSYYSCRKESPLGEYSYRLRTPYVLDAGIAYTIGPIGLISFDYELMDYSIMRFKTVGYDGGADIFRELNQAVPSVMGASHSFRAGTEWKFTPAFAVRAGTSFILTPEHNGPDTYYKDRVRSFTLGFGYSSEGSFFADFAFRMSDYIYGDNFMQRQFYAPYYDYGHYDSYGNFYLQSEEPSPILAVGRKLFDATLTMGWRF